MRSLFVCLIIYGLPALANASFLFDSCATLKRRERPSESLILRLIRQHRVVEHESIGKLETLERHNYLVSFFRQLCLMPKNHRGIIASRKISIHLTAGSIAQHPWIQSLVDPPRGHNVGWDKLPGVAGISQEIPTIIDVTSLNKGHGSSNLVLHEQAHVLDRFFHNSDTSDFDLSPTEEFRTLHMDTPWQQVYAPTLIAYHQKHPEEHFAELYAKWFTSDEARTELRALIPGAEEFFNSLLPFR